MKFKSAARQTKKFLVLILALTFSIQGLPNIVFADPQDKPIAPDSSGKNTPTVSLANSSMTSWAAKQNAIEAARKAISMVPRGPLQRVDDGGMTYKPIVFPINKPVPPPVTPLVVLTEKAKEIAKEVAASQSNLVAPSGIYAPGTPKETVSKNPDALIIRSPSPLPTPKPESNPIISSGPIYAPETPKETLDKNPDAIVLPKPSISPAPEPSPTATTDPQPILMVSGGGMLISVEDNLRMKSAAKLGVDPTLLKGAVFTPDADGGGGGTLTFNLNGTDYIARGKYVPRAVQPGMIFVSDNVDFQFTLDSIPKISVPVLNPVLSVSGGGMLVSVEDNLKMEAAAKLGIDRTLLKGPAFTSNADGSGMLTFNYNGVNYIAKGKYVPRTAPTPGMFFIEDNVDFEFTLTPA